MLVEELTASGGSGARGQSLISASCAALTSVRTVVPPDRLMVKAPATPDFVASKLEPELAAANGHLAMADNAGAGEVHGSNDVVKR